MINGLNVGLGLTRVLGKKKPYINMLRKFVAGQTDVAQKIQAAIEAKDRAGAERLSHTVKGLLGNIGAEALQGEAGKIEAMLRQGMDNAAVETLLVGFAARLDKLMTALAATLPPEPEQVVPTVVDEAMAVEVVEKLLFLLEENDARANDFFTEHAELLEHALTAQYAPICQLIQRFDFEAAVDQLKLATKRRNQDEIG